MEQHYRINSDTYVVSVPNCGARKELWGFIEHSLEFLYNPQKVNLLN
jgi:hypothetical protein